MKTISWNKKIPFFKNTYVLRSVFFAYLIAIILMTLLFMIIFGFERNWSSLGQIVLPMIGVYAFVFLLFFVSTWIVMGNKYDLDYTIDDHGFVIQGVHDKAGDIRKIAVIAGVLSGNPGVAGAGLVVKDNVIEIPWQEIKDLRFEYEFNRLILNCSFWKKVAVHYPEDKLTEIEALISKHYKKEADYV